MRIGFWVLSGLLVVIFAGSGGAKLLNVSFSQANAEHLGLTTAMSRAIGAVEILAVAGLITGLFYRPISVAAAVGVVLLMIGAIAYHLRAKDPVGKVIPAVVTALIAIGVAGLAL